MRSVKITDSKQTQGSNLVRALTKKCGECVAKSLAKLANITKQLHCSNKQSVSFKKKPTANQVVLTRHTAKPIVGFLLLLPLASGQTNSQPCVNTLALWCNETIPRALEAFKKMDQPCTTGRIHRPFWFITTYIEDNSVSHSRDTSEAEILAFVQNLFSPYTGLLQEFETSSGTVTNALAAFGLPGVNLKHEFATLPETCTNHSFPPPPPPPLPPLPEGPPPVLPPHALTQFLQSTTEDEALRVLQKNPYIAANYTELNYILVNNKNNLSLALTRTLKQESDSLQTHQRDAVCSFVNINQTIHLAMP